MNKLTEDRLEELLRPFEGCFGPGEADQLLAAANADPDEGADWLPYYKLAVAMNGLTIGYLCGLLKLWSVNGVDDVTEFRTAIKVARTEFAASMVPCGVGPRTDVETWVKVLNKASAIAAGADDFHTLHGEQGSGEVPK